MKRLLVSTALEETWRDDEPVLFLGEWCRRYSRKDRWSKMDAEVLPYHWDDRKKFYADYQYLQEFYEKLLRDLSAQLNQIHGVNHSLRYWRILIGPWLGVFTPTLFDRWTSIQFANSNYDLSGTVILAGQDESLIPKDMDDFLHLFEGDKYNHQLYGVILQQYTKVPCIEVLRVDEESVSIEIPKTTWKRNIKKTLFSSYSRFVSMLTGDQDVFILTSYLKTWDELKLCQRFGQVPQISNLVPTIRVSVDKSQRQWVVAGKSGSDFEVCARSLIPQQIPTAYLEGYDQLIEQVMRSPWPRQPKLIWTSNSHISYDVFKAWTAEKVECGSPLVIGQHGGHYGIGRWSYHEDHEVAISDCYLSWGWSEPDQPKVKPVGQLKGKRPLGVRHAEQAGALLVITMHTRYGYPIRSMIIARQYLDYLDDQYVFVESLPVHIRKALTVRLTRHDYGWDQVARWQDNFPEVCLDKGRSNIDDLIRKSRLCISTYNATNFLESFAMNVPTVIYWNPCHWELRDSAIPYFEDLKRVGIFHETPGSAARHVSTIWDDVDAWWTSPTVQKVLKCFKERYCYADNMLGRLELTLRSVMARSKDLSSGN